MRIAIPVAGGRLAQHFGHCEQFALFDIDNDQKTITGRQFLDAPPHQPGLLPAWLADRGTNVVIAGGMGQRAQSLFSESGITVVIGASSVEPETIVGEWMEGSLRTGDNICDH